MKTITKIVLHISTLLLFIGCSSENSETEPTPTPTPKDMRFVKSIVIDYNRNFEERLDFTYDDKGRIKDFNYSSPDNHIQLSAKYTTNMIQLIGTDKEGEVAAFAELNSSGYMIAYGGVKYDYQDNYIKEQWDNNGKAFYNWNNGNLIGITDSYGDKYVLNYNDILNNPKCNLDLNYLTLNWVEDLYLSFPFSLLGYMGKRSKYMMSELTGDNRKSIILKYDVDSDGFVTKVDINRGGEQMSKATITYY